MKTSSILATAVTTLIAAGLLGGDLVRAFPTSSEPAEVVATDSKAPYRWRDYWERPAAATATACPARKSLSLSWEGPRMTWQRSCGA
ncbi:hypothetical protein ABLE93_16575 [Xanthobacter sp. KR7-65]|uniref:hypothetical protein n=1 Tax=Xanthobacter sp. KR7-65 TaxID=3156612 RepID=UPI0032B38690